LSIAQIQVRYDENEDRLLLRFSTTENCEFRFWLTRRFAKRLWPMLVRMLEWDQAVKQQIDPNARKEVLDIRHEGYVREADYQTQFHEQSGDAPRTMPLGEAPVLLGRAEGKKQPDGGQILTLQPMHGQGIDITCDTRLLHLFMRLLREQVAKTDWDMNLALHDGPAASTEQPRPRTVN
jgi:hypothetical protein